MVHFKVAQVHPMENFHVGISYNIYYNKSYIGALHSMLKQGQEIKR